MGIVQEKGKEGLVIPTPFLRDLTTPPTRVKTSLLVKGAKDGNIVGHRACERFIEGGRDKVEESHAEVSPSIWV